MSEKYEVIDYKLDNGKHVVLFDNSGSNRQEFIFDPFTYFKPM